MVASAFKVLRREVGIGIDVNYIILMHFMRIEIIHGLDPECFNSI
jgi:hypothetical protein